MMAKEDAYQARRDVVTLRDLFDQYKKEHEKTHTTEATTRHDALVAMDKRLDGMNEFRQSMNDMQRDFLRIPDYENRHKALEEMTKIGMDRNGERIALLEQNLAGVNTNRIGKIESELSGMFGRVIGGGIVISILMTVVGIVIGRLGK